jgi:hypothetical protein
MGAPMQGGKSLIGCVVKVQTSFIGPRKAAPTRHEWEARELHLRGSVQGSRQRPVLGLGLLAITLATD